MKLVNRYTSNEFHDWQRENLPRNFIMQDLDTWVLVWSDSTANYEPFALVELKRSYMFPQKWTPWKDDLPNYMALKKLADKAELPFWTIYFQKDKEINDNTIFRIFLIETVADGKEWIKYKDRLISAKEFKERMPNIFP